MPRIMKVFGVALFVIGVSVGCGKKPDPTPEAKAEVQPAPQEKEKGKPEPAPKPKPTPKPKPKTKPSEKRPDVIGGAYNEFTAKNQFRKISFAIGGYELTHKSFPAGIVGPDGKLGLSWRVAILPYLEDDGAKLYKEFKLAEAWDSPHNKGLLTKMPAVFKTPGSAGENGRTYHRAFAGANAFLPLPAQMPKGAQPGQLAHGRAPSAITDGTANTLMLAEANEPVEWTKPDDLVVRDGAPLPKLGLFQKGFVGMMCDSSVHSVPETVTEKSLRALISTNAGDRPGSEVHLYLPPPPKK